MFKINRVLLCLAMLLLLALPVSAAQAQNDVGTISVTGHAEVAVTPDIAFVTVGVVTTGNDVETAKQENDGIMQRISNSLKAQGIAERDIRTSTFSVQPVYRQDKSTKDANAIGSYRMQNSVTVKLDDLNKLGVVVDTLFSAGANQLQGINFALSDDKALKEQLLQYAVKDGQRQATLIADSLGAGLGRPISVVQNGRIYPMQAENYRMLKADMPAGTPLYAGTLTASVDVNMVYAIK